jgi:putative membrane protein
MALSGMAFAHASAQLASTQSDSAAVRTFAELEASEQQAFIMARRLANLPQPEPTSMDAEKGRMIQQLQGVRGPEFDRLFIRGQIAGHQELLRVHQAISSTPENKEEAMLATVAVPAIRTHLAMLDSIQRTL